ncbi:MAG: arginine--tRNA ligase [Lachnospiraceae bacterium]|nr:arginine--tRNA ligase [Lachnospiraceae bacterium]
MEKIIELIEKTVKQAFAACGYDEKLGNCTISNRPDLCQYQCNGALAAAKLYKKAPIAIAQEVAEKLEGNRLFSKVGAVAPGFLNIDLDDRFLREYTVGMSKAPDMGFEKTCSGKVIVDYGGANVAKPLHIGHLRSAVIGESVKRILAFAGFEAIGDVHLGDWGLQMGLIITELRRRNPDLVYFDASFEGEYPSEAPFTISELEEIYPAASSRSKTDEVFKEEAREATAKLQDGDRGYMALWRHILAVSVEDLKKNYDSLNVHFELWKKESDVNSIIPSMIEKIKAQGLAHESDGALVVDVADENDKKEMPPCILLKSDGAALYASTDLATLVERMELYKPCRVIYLTDKRQSLHFEQVFRVARKTGIVPDTTELVHIGFGTMNGKDGKPFKTRDGGVLRLEYLIQDIVDEVAKKIRENRDMSEEQAEATARKVALAALKYGDLSNQASKDYVFDIERFSSFDGNTGPYILYTMVRIKSILAKYMETKGIDPEEMKAIKKGTKVLEGAASAGETNQSERDLMLQIIRYPDAIDAAVTELAPHRICQYIYELSNIFNTFYHENRIITETDGDRQREWIALIVLTLRILEKCIDLLGFDAPEQM